jgi:hypothetical protein
MFAAGFEYRISELEYAPVAAYSETDRTNWPIAIFLESVPFIYNSTPMHVKDLRNLAMSSAISHLRQLTESNNGYTALGSTCLKVPGFAFDVVQNCVKRDAVEDLICFQCSKAAVEACSSDLLVLKCEFREATFRVRPERLALDWKEKCGFLIEHDVVNMVVRGMIDRELQCHAVAVLARHD